MMYQTANTIKTLINNNTRHRPLAAQNGPYRGYSTEHLLLRSENSLCLNWRHNVSASSCRRGSTNAQSGKFKWILYLIVNIKLTFNQNY
jgi:hypothetical protein